MAEKGILYMIPCPISDSTAVYDVVPEANRGVIDSLDYFIVENTRTARRFLSKAHIERPISELEFVELNEHTTSTADVERMLQPILAGRSAGVISEAGVPGVADPGADIVRIAHRHGVRVVPLVVHYLQSQLRGIARALVLADEIFFLGKDVGIAIIKHRTDAVLQHPLYDSAGTWGATAVQKDLGHGGEGGGKV